MIIVNIGLDGKPDIQRIILGNKYENNDETINFVLPDEINQYHKYIIAVMEMTEEPNITTLLPVNDNAFVVSSSLTYKSGTWKLYLMCRENEVDISGDVVDISPKENEHVWISNTMFGVVNDNLIDKEIVDNVPLDTNLKIIYDDLNALIDSVNTKLENGDFNGKDGEDGFSPSASVTQEEDGAVISVTDKSGSTNVKVLNGKNGSDGADGKSAYELAVENGFEGTEEEWLESLKGESGKNGESGEKGDTGLTPNIQIGTVTTLEPDQQATVERTGDNENPVFNFGIPRGKDSDVQQEVEDIRVGYDGTTYENAGEAVRGQVGNNANNLEILQKVAPMLSDNFDGFIVSDLDNNVGCQFLSKDIWEQLPYNKKYGWGGHPYGNGELPPFSRISGVLESDMYSVRGGKGRWNKDDTGNFKHGGHLFEGWNAEEDVRLTFGIGLNNKDIAWIQTFHPATEVGTDRGSYYAITKLGSDLDNQGTNFMPTITQSRSIFCLKVGNGLKPDAKHVQKLVDAKELVDWEYNSTDMIPYGSMYFDYDEDKVKVYTRLSGWRTLKFEEEE